MKRILNNYSITLIIFLALIVGGIIYNIIYKSQLPLNKINNNKQKIIFGSLPLSLNLPLFIAEQQGFFSKNGLQVKIEPFQDGGQITNALFTGKLDVGLAAVQLFLSAQSITDQTKIRIISMQIEDKNNPVYELIVGKNINSYKDLNNKKIGYFPSVPATKLLLNELLDKKGVHDTTVLQFSPSTIVPALNAGEVDAIFSTEPFTTLAKKRKLGISIEENKGIVAQSVNINPLAAGAYLLSNDFTEKHPDAARKLILSLDEAIDFMRNNPDKAIKAWNLYLPDQQKSLIPDLRIPSYWKSDEIKIDKIKAFQQLLLDKGVLKKAVDINSLLFK